MKEIILNTTAKSVWTVKTEHLAINVGSGDQEVFSTPSLVALMENSAVNAISEFLEEGETSVGVEINVKHISATPLNVEVTSTAKIVEVDGRKVAFTIEAFDNKEKIGEATHTRFVLNAQKFMAKTSEKAK